jgi:pyridoxamine 5'-phosphate oxidase family protein
MFSDSEVEYLKNQHLARLATVSSKGQPDVVPVGFEFDGRYFWIGSGTQEIFLRTMKYANVRDGNQKVALVVDDLESIDPWKPRSIKVYGTAEVMDHDGRFGSGKYLRVTPKVSWAMGLKGHAAYNREYKASGAPWRTRTVHNDS